MTAHSLSDGMSTADALMQVFGLHRVGYLRNRLGFGRVDEFPDYQPTPSTGSRSKAKAGNAHIDSLLDCSGGRGKP